MELARLGRLSFFQGIPRWALIRLAEAATEEELPAGGMVFRQSDRARAAHFLLAGSVQILIQVGEEDLLVTVPTAVFEELFERDPALAYQILQRVAASVADRLEHTRERLCPPPRQALVAEGKP